MRAKSVDKAGQILARGLLIKSYMIVFIVSPFQAQADAESVFVIQLIHLLSVYLPVVVGKRGFGSVIAPNLIIIIVIIDVSHTHSVSLSH